MACPQSFTVKADRILAVLTTRVRVSQAFEPSILAAGGGLPGFVEVDAIWDTGATGSVITQQVVDELGLKPISMTKVHGVGGESISEVFLVNVIIQSNTGFANVRVTKGQLIGAAVLIGMDIISRGDFAVTNYDGKTVFTFRCPSQEHIDFVNPPQKH